MGKSSGGEDFDGQLPGEELEHMFRKHPVVMRKGLMIASLGLLAGPLYVLIASEINESYIPSMNAYMLILLGSFLLAAILFFPSWMGWYFSMYLITNQRFIQIYQKGFFHKSVSDTPINQIQSVNYEVKGVQETLLGFGTIVVQTYLGDIVMHYMHHPERTSKKFTDVLRKYNVQPADFPPHDEEE